MTDSANPEHSQDREFALFTRAKALPPEERRAFVEREAAGDPKLLRAVLSLLGEPVDAAPPVNASPIEVEPQVTIDLPTGSSDAGAWQRYLDQLHSRGPAFQRYVFKGEVARGGMGVIHRVFDQDARRHLALKVLLGSDTAANGSTPLGSPVDSPVDSHSLGRFLEEAQVTSQLDHPGIVPVHEIGVDSAGRVYFTMKLVKGETLKEVFAKVHANHPDWSFPRALSLVLRVCEAMSYAHAKGVLHRDLKPANVMVGRFGEVYVMDWGLARVLGSASTGSVYARATRTTSTSSGDQSRPNDVSVVETERHELDQATPHSAYKTMYGHAMGTPAYMPPEQAEGRLDDLGPTSDVYAVGAILYHLIAGHSPYGENRNVRLSTNDLLRLVVAGPPRKLDTFATETPPELIAICEKAMARDAKARYLSMDDFAQDMRAYLDHRVVAAYETGAIAKLKKWIQRNPVLASAAGLLVIVLASAFVLVTQKNRDLAERNLEIERRGREIQLRTSQFDQLSGVVKLTRARVAMEGLFPPWPDRVAAMSEWLRDHAAGLSELKPKVDETIASLESDLERESVTDPASATADGSAEQFLLSTLERLSADLEEFAVNDRSRIERGLKWATRIESLTLRHPNAKTTWDEARRSILKADDVVASRLYASFPGGPPDLAPQMGLVPIGMNPVTKLWEFYELRTACDVVAGQDPATIEIPTHREDGSIDVTPETGIVFVLIPGGAFLMGSQFRDANAPNYNALAAPAESDHENHPIPVTLAPFFLARHEITQAQWNRLNGSNPSQHHVGIAIHGRAIQATNPVDSLSWNLCTSVLRELGLDLPTEAQWEYACRAGTSTVWWTGSSIDGLDRAANVCDVSATSLIQSWTGDPELNDGFVTHAPVGSFAANPFGLFDTMGNLREWCRDVLNSYDIAPRPGDGERVAAESRSRVYRGGSFWEPAKAATSSARDGVDPAAAMLAMGCRAARPLLPR